MVQEHLSKMTRILLAFLSTVALITSAAADEIWSGEWEVEWRTGGSVLLLQQQGSNVEGQYLSGRGKLQAVASGSQLSGTVTYDRGFEKFTITLASDGQSFSGRTETRSWLSGRRLKPGASLEIPEPDLRNPRSAFASFLVAANMARDGKTDAWSSAAASVDFGELTKAGSQESWFAAAEQLFQVIDLATFELSDIPESAGPSPLKIALPQQNSKATIDLEMVQAPDGQWRILLPPPASLQAALDSAQAQTADGYLNLKSPRDTVRTFLEGMRRWSEGGDHLAIDTIDLTSVPQALKIEQGRLTAQYLVRIIDRIGAMFPQGIPNSGNDREHYVYFKHPVGSIVIEPVDTDGSTKWRFSTETLKNAPALYHAIQELPAFHALDPRSIPHSSRFAIGEWVRRFVPAVGSQVPGRTGLEYWQLIAITLVVLIEVVIAVAVRAINLWLLTAIRVTEHISSPKRLATAVGICVATLIGWWIVPMIGLPASIRQYTLPILGTLIIAVSTYIVWQLISALVSIMRSYTEGPNGHIDRTPLAFAEGIARLALILTAGYSLALWWSIPTNGLLAGLGIGGLALALASKQSLSNLFGTGILLGDRPFRTGDRVIADNINGVVEEVGIRSTRIRTSQDSLLVVPNGELARLSIDNLGARRKQTFHSNLLVSFGPEPEKFQEFVEAIMAKILSQPIFLATSTKVHISSITTRGVEIEVSTALDTLSNQAYREATHALLLDILRLAGERGLLLGRDHSCCDTQEKRKQAGE